MKLIRLILFVFIFLIVIVSIIISFSYSFLAFNKPVKSNTIVLEAWISAYEVETVAKQFNDSDSTRFIIVGRKYENDKKRIDSISHNYFKTPRPLTKKKNKVVCMATNSGLLFNLDKYPVINPGDTINITIKAKGTEAEGRFAHFNLVFNGEYCESAFTNEIVQDYIFKIVIPDSGLYSLMVRFDNDLYTGTHDRNLNIISLKINETEIPATEQNTCLIKESGRTANGFGSQAEEITNYLIQLGLKPEKITSISFTRVKKNQTLAGAVAFDKWVQKGNISSVNVVSSGLHSRRTWITYKKILDKNMDIGIISMEPVKYNKKNWWKKAHGIKVMIDEFFSYLLNWIGR